MEKVFWGLDWSSLFQVPLLTGNPENRWNWFLMSHRYTASKWYGSWLIALIEVWFLKHHLTKPPHLTCWKCLSWSRKKQNDDGWKFFVRVPLFFLRPRKQPWHNSLICDDSQSKGFGHSVRKGSSDASNYYLYIHFVCEQKNSSWDVEHFISA